MFILADILYKAVLLFRFHYIFCVESFQRGISPAPCTAKTVEPSFLPLTSVFFIVN